MNRRLFGAFGVLAIVLSVGSCKSDPLSDLDGKPAAVVTNFSYLQMPIGDTAVVTASVLDARTTPLEIPITFAACTNDVTVTPDTSYQPHPAQTSARAIVVAVSANPSCVRVSGGGVADSVSVAVLPPVFGGAFSSATVAGGDTLRIASTNLLKFHTATVSVTFAGGGPALIVSKTADTLVVLVPFGTSGIATISGIAVTYAPGVIVTLPSTNSVTQTGDAWSGDDAFATAPAIALPTAAGKSTYVLTNFSGTNNTAICGEASGPCTIYKYTVVDSTELTFTVDWDSDADLDVYSCDGPSAAACFEEGGAGATGAQPEKFEFTAAPGTHYFVVENFSHDATANIYVTISR